MPGQPSSPGDPASASVVVPATTANLGCAFDCAGLALNLYLRASAAARPSGFEVAYRGPGAGEIPLGRENLIVRAMLRAAARAGRELPGARLEVESEIPLGVGLGSSAAAIVAGVLLGARLAGAEMSPGEALALANEVEGHADNVAAALHGGMVVALAAERKPAAPPSAQKVGASAQNEILVAKAHVSPQLDFVAVVPEVPLPTEKARSVLPASYSRADVVANLQRTALLAASFFSGRDLSPELFRDRLHQPYRSPLVPGIAGCLDYRHPGLAGVFLSGAGSAVMAIARHGAREIGDALVAEFRRNGVTARALLLKADNRGAQLAAVSS